MGICYMAVNQTKGEFVDPVQYVNEKSPWSNIYANFIVWLMQHDWRYDEVVLLGDNEDSYFRWMETAKYHKEVNASDRLWLKFIKYTDYDVETGEFK